MPGCRNFEFLEPNPQTNTCDAKNVIITFDAYKPYDVETGTNGKWVAHDRCARTSELWGKFYNIR